jgi:small-conductance mechanosensitive channel
MLLHLAEVNPLALQEPEPIVIFTGFGSSSIDILFGVWVLRKDFLKLKNSIQQEIKKAFDEEGIEIPFPHLSLYAGSATEPFPVRVVHEQDELS